MPLDASRSVPIYAFPGLGAFPELTHAISTRHGGVSAAPFATLNLAWSVGDSAQNVVENHQRLCDTLGLPVESLVSPRQVHGCQVHYVGAEHRGTLVPGCDALITDRPGVALLLRFADCVPVLLYDPRRKAIGLAHSGWRGTVARVAGATVRAMAERFGSHPGELLAAIGPAIGPCCYEIGQDVLRGVENTFGRRSGLISLRQGPRAGQGGRPCTLPDWADPSRQVESRSRTDSLHLDLWAANARLLREVGVQSIESAGVCTFCHCDDYYSFRAESGSTGHHGAVICLRG